MKISILVPDYVTDYYGRSAITIIKEASKYPVLINQCDSDCDIVFCTTLYDSRLLKLYKKFRRKYKKPIFINYLWDLPFWRMAHNHNNKFLFKFRDLISIRMYPFLFRSWREQYFRYLTSSDYAACTSIHTKNEIKKYLNVDVDVLHLYFPNIDILKRDLNIESEIKKTTDIIYAGRIEEYKRVEVLIRAVAKLKNKNLVRLKIVGRGTRERACIELAESLGVNAQFLGYQPRDRMHQEIANAKIYVSTSVNEGNPGWVPCEAAWLGTAILVANIPEVYEFFGDADVYFKKDDENDLAKRLEYYLLNAQDRIKNIEDVRKNIEFYTVGNGIKRMESYFENILNNG